MKSNILVKEIIDFLKADIISVLGETDHLSIKHLRPIEHVDEHTLDWVNNIKHNKQEIAENSKARVLFVDNEVKYSESIQKQKKVLLFVANPKLAIAKVAHEFFVEKLNPLIHASATIHPDAKIGKDVYIGPNVVIEKCNIGDNVIIHGNCFLYDNCRIEKNVELHAGVIIANDAHNFISDGNNEKTAFPHLGGVIINENVVIGAQTCISSGVLDDTTIGKGSKIAQLVFIGANNKIGENCLIRPNVMTSGSVKIGANSIIAPSVTIREHKIIGKNCFIGMGAVVTKNVPDGETWIGNPARRMNKK